MAGHGLCARVNVGPILREQLGRILGQDGIVAEEIRPTDGVTFIEVVVHLAQGVL